MPTRVTRGAWVREKKRKPKEVDPTVALLPALRYFGCRPNMPELRREKLHHQQAQNFNAIEIVPPMTHHRPSSRHESEKQQQQHHHHHHQSPRNFRPPEPEIRAGPSSHHANKRPLGKPAAVHEVQSRLSAATRHSQLSSKSRPHASAHSHVRASPHMTRAMAVNMNAITPLEM